MGWPFVRPNYTLMVALAQMQTARRLTSLTMTAAGLSATIIAYFISESPVIKQIMLILILGLLMDLIITWIQSAGLLRWYLKHKEAKTGRAA